VRRDESYSPAGSRTWPVALCAVVAAGVVLALTGSVAPAEAAFPGSNGLIAFTRVTSRGSEIAVVRPDRTGFRTLIPNATAPAWSPDGRLIAFDRKTSRGDRDLFIANADGSAIRRLDSVGSSDEEDPSWSPDGSQIAYTDGDDIYVVDADGTNTRALTDDHLEATFPAWSPTGEWIAFITQEGRITMAHPDGSGRHDVGGRSAGWLSWSPDGTKIAFADDGPARRWQDIYVADADGGHAHDITPWPGYQGMPSWSPDGTQLIYGLVETKDGHVGEHTDLYVMNPDGTDARPLVRGPAAKWGADWQAVNPSPTG